MNKIGVNRSVILSSIMLVLFFLGCVLIDKLLLPQIYLKGEESVVINYDDAYVEKGYKAKFLGSNITSKVKVSGEVNTKVLGTYEVSYTINKGFFKKKITRYVLVEDNEKPKLNISKGKMYVCPGSDVVKEKVTAKDNYDGDISSKVKTKITRKKIIYSVTDSSGNKTTVVKKIVFQDREKPIIKLDGESEISLQIGEKYSEPGYSATDNCDKDITKNVEVSGSVNENAEGVYIITYTVKDDASNETIVERKINVLDNKGIIYLTFDDGPNDGTTNVILDILKEEGVKATFFVTSKGPDDLIKREYDEGHTVALHTSSHNYALVYASDEAFFNDLQTVGDRVKRITGEESKIIRFPGGSSNTISRKYSPGIMSRLTQEVLNRGYKYYDWNISSGDAGNTTDANVVYSNVVNSLNKDRVNMVLMHDIKSYTRDALRNIIRYGKNNGYRFEKITMGTEMITQRVNN